MNDQRAQLILELLSEGNKGEEIAKKLNLSRRTVEKYIEYLKQVHAARNSTHLVAIALRDKIIQ